MRSNLISISYKHFPSNEQFITQKKPNWQGTFCLKFLCCWFWESFPAYTKGKKNTATCKYANIFTAFRKPSQPFFDTILLKFLFSLQNDGVGGKKRIHVFRPIDMTLEIEVRYCTVHHISVHQSWCFYSLIRVNLWYIQVIAHPLRSSSRC